MHAPNAARIMDMLSETDVVLDVGGWARPFNRANWVIDAEPWHSRGYYGDASPAQGGVREHFTEATWIQRDVCAHEPFPFRDKEIDFVICSHTLEDVRDPLWVCSEMIRVAKRGYLEVPSRIAESCRGIEPGQVGWSHHRWLITIAGRSVEFLMKFHTIHSHWRFSLPASYLRRMSTEARVQWLYWDDDFEFGERTIHGVDKIAEELERFVRRVRPYSPWRLGVARAAASVGRLRARAVSAGRRRLGRVVAGE